MPNWGKFVIINRIVKKNLWLHHDRFELIQTVWGPAQPVMHYPRLLTDSNIDGCQSPNYEGFDCVEIPSITKKSVSELLEQGRSSLSLICFLVIILNWFLSCDLSNLITKLWLQIEDRDLVPTAVLYEDH